MKLRVFGEPPSGAWHKVRLVAKDRRSEIVPPLSDGEFSASPGSLLSDRALDCLYAGVGDSEKVDASAVRVAVGSAVLALRKWGRTRVAVELAEWSGHAAAAAEGAVLGGYRYETFLSKKTRPISEVGFVVSRKEASTARGDVERGRILGEAGNLARDVANTPGNLLYPESLADAATGLARKTGLRVRILDEKALKAGRFGGMLAVGGGSARGPRMIALEHGGGKKGEAPLVFVGKAITFDSGGISIKPAAGMEEMIFDMCGGASVLGAMQAVAELGVRRNVVGILASAENMPSSTAYRPGDIVTTRSGVTVEVVNTDAEGRMVLADALHWAGEEYRAARIVDLATLTGACGVALGQAAAGMWTNDEAFQRRVFDAALHAGERVWPMPMFPEYSSQIKSQVAEIKNSGGRLGGACTAAAFLKEFVGKTPWVHLDVAYTTHRSKDAEGLASGATGFGVRTLVELALMRDL
jgi:leucyl aminopeptidase